MMHRVVALFRPFVMAGKPAHMRNACFAAALSLACAVSANAQAERPALIQSTNGAPSPSAISSASVASIGGLTDEPISAGQVVHVTVFNAPDFSLTTRVSEDGNIPFAILGSIHIDGLNSASASKLIEDELRQRNLMVDPHVTVTVDTYASGITILGEVHAPGIYPVPGKHLLSDVIATAGGLSANSGRVIEISNNKTPDSKEELAWDPTMRNTTSYDYPVHAGDRILVRACGIAYVGGHVARPGAYSLCGSPNITLSELIALAGGVVPLTSEKHSYIIREQADRSRVVQEVDVHKILRGRVADPVIHEDDIVYVTPSTVKDLLNRALGFSLTAANTLFYNLHP